MSTDPFDRRYSPPPRRRSRPITLALLGAAVLSSCICCLIPAPNNAAPDGGGDFGPDATPGSGRTPSSARNDVRADQQRVVRHSYMPFWIPFFFGGGSAPVRNPNVRSTPAPRATPNVTRGGFGNSGIFGGGS